MVLLVDGERVAAVDLVDPATPVQVWVAPVGTEVPADPVERLSFDWFDAGTTTGAIFHPVHGLARPFEDVSVTFTRLPTRRWWRDGHGTYAMVLELDLGALWCRCVIGTAAAWPPRGRVATVTPWSWPRYRYGP